MSSFLRLIYEFQGSLLGLSDVKNPLEGNYYHNTVHVVAPGAWTKAESTTGSVRTLNPNLIATLGSPPSPPPYC